MHTHTPICHWFILDYGKALFTAHRCLANLTRSIFNGAMSFEYGKPSQCQAVSHGTPTPPRRLLTTSVWLFCVLPAVDRFSPLCPMWAPSFPATVWVCLTFLGARALSKVCVCVFEGVVFAECQLKFNLRYEFQWLSVFRFEATMYQTLLLNITPLR